MKETVLISASALRKHCKQYENCQCCNYSCYEVVTNLFTNNNEQPCFWSNTKIAQISEMIEIKLK